MVNLQLLRFLAGFDVHDGHQFYLRAEQISFRHASVLLPSHRALSIQITLELPSMTVLTKCDLVKEK